MLRPFLLEAKRVGFDVVEVSDNCVELTPRQRRAQIRLAVECGLAVFGEVGSKDAKNDAGLLVSQAEDCFAAGAELVLVEAAELIVDGKPKMKLINGLRAGLDMSRVLIELPGPWISNITLSVVEDMKKFLVGEFGPDVNIANVMPADIMETEALRVGLGVVGPQVSRK
jgi:phosphosulfolactate synthase